METIKEEKKADLEQLLNSLIEKGWKPFGEWWLAPYIEIHGRDISFYKLCDDWMREWVFDTDIRAVLSIDSWLWQFVCENGMLETKGNVRVKNYWGDDECDDNCCDDDLEYWLMESALCDENKLEDFLLSNIKVDVKGD